jgi:hypothetical protein
MTVILIGAIAFPGVSQKASDEKKQQKLHTKKAYTCLNRVVGKSVPVRYLDQQICRWQSKNI